MHTKSFLILLVAGFLMLGASSAWAGAHHWAGYQQRAVANPDQPEYQTLSPDQQKQLDALMQEFRQSTQDLRDQVDAKKLELDTLGRTPNPNEETVAKVAQEFVKLRNQLRQERQAFRDKVEKEFGFNPLAKPAPRPEYGKAPFPRYGADPNYPPCPMHGYGCAGCAGSWMPRGYPAWHDGWDHDGEGYYHRGWGHRRCPY